MGTFLLKTSYINNARAHEDVLILPNQNNYTIAFQFECEHQDLAVLVRNINIIIIVNDGLSPSN